MSPIDAGMVLIQKEAGVRRDFFPKLKRVLVNVRFTEDVVAAYFCAFDPATPLRAKTILIGALAYFILSLDVVPDFVLGLGFTDDMAVLLVAVNVVRTHLHQRHLDRAREALDRLKQGNPVSVSSSLSQSLATVKLHAHIAPRCPRVAGPVPI